MTTTPKHYNLFVKRDGCWKFTYGASLHPMAKRVNECRGDFKFSLGAWWIEEAVEEDGYLAFSDVINAEQYLLFDHPMPATIAAGSIMVPEPLRVT